MKKFINFKTLFLLSGLIIFQNNSVFTKQNISDLNSNKASAGFTLPGPPIVIWVAPFKQYTIQKSQKASITVKVKTTSGLSSVSVYLNDVLYGAPEMTSSTTEVATFIATKTLTLEPGENSIYLVAITNEGTTTSEKRVINVQLTSKTGDPATTKPSIEWSAPAEKYVTVKSSSVNISASISSPSDLKSVVLFLNGISLGATGIKRSSSDTVIYVVEETLSLRQTENIVFLEASNTAGSVTSDKRFITVPASSLSTFSEIKSLSKTPAITWVTPTAFTSTTRSNKTTINATVKSSSGISSVSLYLNDVLYGAPEMTISTTEIGTFIATKSLPLEPGENRIYLIATNSEGSTTSETRFITVPLAQKADGDAIGNTPLPPAIVWAAPTEKITTLKSASADIQLTIKSSSALKSVLLYLNGIPQGECEVKPSASEKGSFILEKSISFKQVENNIYLEAENAGGITTSLSRNFICPSSSLVASQPTTQTTTQIPPKTNETAVAEKPVVTENTQVNKPPVQKAVDTEPVQASSATPVITWTSPSGTRTKLDTYTAPVKANIKSSNDLRSVLIYVNGVSKGDAEIKPLAEAGSYQMEKVVTFSPGENELYIVATNSTGSTRSELRYFSNPSAVVPEISWSNPSTPNSVVNVESFNVSACIKSASELRSVKLLVNGNIQSEDNVFQISPDENCNYQWKSSVVLKDGDNSIYIIATNGAGSITSDKRVVKYSQAITEKRLALVFGNSEYKNKAPLKNPVNDANLIEGTLKQLGFDVIKRLNVGKVEMEAAIREFNEKLPDYSVALFYYAGHGNQVDGKNFLIPTDAVLEKPGDCKYEAIDVNYVVEEFDKYPDNTNIVILDACRSNPFASWSRGGEAGFRPISFTSGTIIAYATSPGATAADGKGSNGLYTEELVKQMVIPQPISTVFSNTRIQVRKLSSNQQVPSEMNQLNGEFYFKK
ncbi:MAG: caspase family protein [Bacteroidia bacterium]|nr:caspase family protein [Bacteroidia bacterium]